MAPAMSPMLLRWCVYILGRRGDAVFLSRANVGSHVLLLSCRLFAGIVIVRIKKAESGIRKPVDSPKPLENVTCLLRIARQACRSVKRQTASVVHHRRLPKAEDRPPREG